VDVRQPDSTIDTSVPDCSGEGGDQDVGMKNCVGRKIFDSSITRPLTLVSGVQRHQKFILIIKTTFARDSAVI
jgi:hypothetical protein